jgi:SAM-dependent methyltransferase
MLRWLRWHLAKMRLAAGPLTPPPPHVRVTRRKHAARAEDFPPSAEPYRRLAALWDDYAAWFVPRYDLFLPAAAAHYRVPVRSVLDLACGTGLLSRRIAGRAESVVGLDASEDMLGRARSRAGDGNVRYERGDFRDFSLGETFDAAVCGSDSLNYVEAPGQLEDVFRCVRRHLRPGGLFAFDVLDERYFRALSLSKAVAEVGGEQFELYTFYDAGRRVSESRVVLGGAVERHRRVPVEEGDVRVAAAGAGLAVAEHFSRKTYLRLGPAAVRQFYVLRAPPP